METLLGSSLTIFLGMTVMLFGACALMTGRALAMTWRPIWQALPYGLLLGIGCRYLIYALFQGELLSLGGFIASTLILTGLCLLAYRAVQARLMVRQYPWLYAPAGPLGWRRIDGSNPPS